jgi:hypothetical protein
MKQQNGKKATFIFVGRIASDEAIFPFFIEGTSGMLRVCRSGSCRMNPAFTRDHGP